MELGLKGRVAVVTGGAAGIGAAIARTLANEGCCVWVADMDGVQAERTASALSIGSTVHAVTLDVSSKPEVEAAIERIVQAESRLDILVCNAGILKSGPFLEFYDLRLGSACFYKPFWGDELHPGRRETNAEKRIRPHNQCGFHLRDARRRLDRKRLVRYQQGWRCGSDTRFSQRIRAAQHHRQCGCARGC